MSNSIDLKPLFIKLKTANPNIDSIHVNYYGSGDSFESFEAPEVVYNHLGTQDSLNREDLENLCFEVLEKSSISFINEGGFGNIIINFDYNEIEINPSYYQTTSYEAHPSLFEIDIEETEE